MLAAVLALLSALLFAVGSAAQQKEASSVAPSEATGFKLIGRLVRRPFWLLGVGCDGAAYATQAGALAVGSILLVQPILVTTLLFALPISAKMTGRKLYLADGKKRQRTWQSAVAAMQKLGVPQSRIDHLLAKNDPALVAQVVKELQAKG